MRTHFAVWILILSLCGFAASSSPGAPGIAQPDAFSLSTLSERPLSERVVAYQIDARFDPARHTVDATEILTYRNLTGRPQDTFPFHLYLNAFNPKSTFATGARRDRSGVEWQEKYRASAEVKSLEAVGIGDLTAQIKFISPDDGNLDDRTVQIHSRFIV